MHRDHANELTIELVDGSNETLYSGKYFSVPSTLLHLKNYYDLSPSTYLELVDGSNETLNSGKYFSVPWRQART